MSKQQQGFTLLEVVISMVVFVLVTLVFVTLFSAASNIQSRSNHITKVNNEAAQDIERGTGGSAGTMEIRFPGTSFNKTISGNYLTGTTTGTTYKYFKPDGWRY